MSEPMSEPDHDYVIGTHDAEIERLGVQHRVWRASVLDLWNKAGVSTGQTVIDAGAGSGYATRDLAEIVGPKGRVIALERSHRFLAALNANAEAHGLANVEAVDTDLMRYTWPDGIADRIWCRWVLMFLANAAPVVRGFARALKPGGKAIIQEYYDYARGTWRRNRRCSNPTSRKSSRIGAPAAANPTLVSISHASCQKRVSKSKASGRSPSQRA